MPIIQLLARLAIGAGLAGAAYSARSQFGLSRRSSIAVGPEAARVLDPQSQDVNRELYVTV